jgi:hypothetical protein
MQVVGEIIARVVMTTTKKTGMEFRINENTNSQEVSASWRTNHERNFFMG